MIDLFRLVLVVNQFRNFSKAARALGMTQSTLSRRIQAFEEELGVRLFNRSRGLEPTEYGQLVLSCGSGIVADVEKLKHTLDQMRGLEVGKLAIAVGQFVARTWVGDAVARILQSYPGLEIRINEEEWWKLKPALQEREVEIAVGDLSDDQAPEPEIVFEPLPRRQGFFCCRRDHPLAQHKKVSLEELCAYPLAAPKFRASMAAGLPSGHQFGEFEKDMRYFVPRICSSNFYTALRIVAQTDALGFILPSFAASEIADGSIVVLPFKAPWAVTNYGIMYLRGRMLSRPAAAFRAAAVSAEKSYFSGNS
jgi:DNA-binding transcriptional LysR family regulator